MRSIVLFSLAIVTSLISSCGSTSSSSGNRSYQDPHAKMHRQLHNELYQEEIEKEFNIKINAVVGDYKGTLPCADCGGISMQLQLFQDMTYSSETLYKGKMDTAHKISGSFVLNEEGIIELDQANAGFSYFQKDGSNLRVLDKNGRKIISSLTEAYMLKPYNKEIINNYTSDHPKADFYRKKWDQGISFYGKNSKTSWTLEIKKSSNLRFIDPAGNIFEFPTVDPLAGIDSNSLGFRSRSEDHEIIIQLLEQECSDEGSDEKYMYKVHLKFKQKKDKDFKIFEGCGNMVPDYRLNGVWKIVKVNDQYINPDSFQNKEPQITFDLFKEKFWGNDGCNNFQGMSTYKMDHIMFGPSAGTLMACPNDDVSMAIMKSFSEKKLTYDLSNELVLYHGKSHAMTLRRVE